MMVVIESEEDLIAIIYAAAQRGKLLEAQNKRLTAERDALSERVRRCGNAEQFTAFYRSWMNADYDCITEAEACDNEATLFGERLVEWLEDAARAAIEQGE